MRMFSFFFFCFWLCCTSCKHEENAAYIYNSEILQVEQISDHCFRHISHLKTKSYGLFPCNGLIVIDNQEAIVLDTPVDSLASAELIRWIQDSQNAKISYVVPTHFHVDCTGGLNAFHEQGIPSIASQKTLNLSQEKKQQVPQLSFEDKKVFKVGNEEVAVEHFGEGHTKDNVTVIVKNDQVLFGGCLIKSDGAGKGNLADANVSAWSNTVVNLKRACEEHSIKTVVPGHGGVGGMELLDYTIQLFTKK